MCFYTYNICQFCICYWWVRSVKWLCFDKCSVDWILYCHLRMRNAYWNDKQLNAIWMSDSLIKLKSSLVLVWTHHGFFFIIIYKKYSILEPVPLGCVLHCFLEINTCCLWRNSSYSRKDSCFDKQAEFAEQFTVVLFLGTGKKTGMMIDSQKYIPVIHSNIYLKPVILLVCRGR